MSVRPAWCTGIWRCTSLTTACSSRARGATRCETESGGSRNRLAAHPTPDGLLGGAAQSNKGGDSLQQSSYRVIYQMATGLKAQLMAALEQEIG
jgi:hypothetical protein